MPDFDEFREVFGDIPAGKTKKQPEWHPTTGGGLKPAPAIKKPKPDAIALCIIHTRCTCCGSVAEYPSSHLLCRYGPRDGKMVYVWTDAAADSYPAGTRYEVIHHETTNANCSRCFGPFVAASLAAAARTREAPAGPALFEVIDGGSETAPSHRSDPADEICLDNHLIGPDQSLSRVRGGS